MVAVPASETDVRRVLGSDGKPLPGVRVPSIPDATLARMFEVMALTRVLDQWMAQLSRQGRIASYPAPLGEEASQLAVAPLAAADWVFPSPRDHGAWLWRGYALQQLVDQLFGNADDPSKGRQAPAYHAARWLNLVSVSAPAGTQLPQAVGAAFAARRMKRDGVAMTLFGEAATSTGEFHVGMNFAAVWKAPCVFVCVTGGPPDASPVQTAARTFAAKAAGYGMPAIRVMGNDALAIWEAAREAIERARAGDGPTLIETVADRAVVRSQSPDDPAVQRRVAQKDPLVRLGSYLRHVGLASERWEAEVLERCEHEVAAAIAAAERKPPPAIDSLFDDVYEQLPWHLREQRAYAHALPRGAIEK